MSKTNALLRSFASTFASPVRREVKSLVRQGNQANTGRRWKEAAAAYEAALALDPRLAPIWVQYGHALKEQGFLIRAEEAYRKALQLDGAKADTHLQLGHVLKLQGRLEAAAAAYKESYLLDPTSLHSRAELKSIGRSIQTGDLQSEVEDVIGPKFDHLFYLQAQPQLREAPETDLLRHYLLAGWRNRLDPSRSFSTGGYLDRNPDVRAAGINPFYHYLTCGKFEGRPPGHGEPGGSHLLQSPDARLAATVFDASYYIKENPDLAALPIDPLLHYLHTGWRSGANPSEAFSTRDYLEMNPDIVASNQNPLVHYLRFGQSEGRLPKRPQILLNGKPGAWLSEDGVSDAIAPYFDKTYYAEQYDDIYVNKIDPILHYIYAGAAENRDPAPWFSTQYYKERHPAVVKMDINPLFHYAIWGKEHGYTTFRADQGAAIAKIVPGARLVDSPDLRALLQKAEAPARPHGRVNPAKLTIHWVIPDYNAGGGGHMTIFRIIKWLEFFGHECTIWVQFSVFDRSDAEREEILIRSFQIVKATVRVLPPDYNFEGVDALIATSWDSAYIVKAATGPKAKYYFVQDYEPFFYPVGARSLAAKHTYSFGLYCICASQWLTQLMETHGNRARPFALAADESYRPPEVRVPNAIPRIAFYAREHTTRRAVELGLLALELLAERGERFHVDFFGNDHHFEKVPFSATSWGIQDPVILSRLYGTADLGVCFSATNYSLVPQEMMACGLPVVELDTESTRAAFPAGVTAMALPDPTAIADLITRLLHNPLECRAQAARASEWVATLSWEGSARAVEAALLDGLSQFIPASAPPASSPAASAIRASVVIPTYNAGPTFPKILAAVLGQRAPWPFEIVIVDSGSSDGTWECVLEHAGRGVRGHQIPKKEFQHGRTRNLGVSLARGEFVAMITQDAMPTNELWLYNFVVALERFPRAAGAFGRHYAWPESSAFTQRDLEAHFSLFDRQPILVSKYLNPAKWREEDPGHLQFLHFFSDNNACIRKSVWSVHPYPEVEFGEDQMWAKLIISKGYSKLYVQKAGVFHAHDYGETETFERAKIEAQFFRKQFDYDMTPDYISRAARTLNADDERWGIRNGVSRDVIEQQKKLNVQRLLGIATGSIGPS